MGYEIINLLVLIVFEFNQYLNTSEESMYKLKNKMDLSL